MTLQARPTTTPSKWLLRFVKVDDTTQVQVCIASAITNTGDPVQLTFTEVSSGAAPLSGTITLVPGQWNLQVCEQASTTNLDYLQSDRIDVFTALVEVKGASATPPAPTSCCDVIEANTWVETKACMDPDAIQDATDDLCALPNILDCTQLVNAAIVAGASPYNGVYFPIWDENDAHWHYYLDGDINSYSIILRGSWTLDVITADTTGGEYPWDVAWSGLSGGTVTQATVADLGCGGGGDVDIEINGTPYDTITAPATFDIPVLATDFLTQVGSDFGGAFWIIGDATVRTTDGLTNVGTVIAEGNFDLPPIIIPYRDAANLPSGTIQYDTAFDNDNDLNPDTEIPRREIMTTAGGSGQYADLGGLIADTLPVITVPTQSGIVYQFGYGLWSGQSTNYYGEDEGYLYANSWFDYTAPTYPASYAKLGANFQTLASNNVFGNTNRFTAPDGSAYATSGNRSVIDHRSGLEWYIHGSVVTGLTWTQIMDFAAALSFDGKSDWVVPTIGVFQTIADYGLSQILNHSAFLITGFTYPTCTTLTSSTGNLYGLIMTGSTTNGTMIATTKSGTSLRNYILVRKAYV